jgi:hypothetical protein
MDVLDNFKNYIDRLKTTIQNRVRLVQGVKLNEAVHELFILRKKILLDLNRKYNNASKLSIQYAESTLGRLEESISEYVSKLGQSLKDAIAGANIGKADDFLNGIVRYVDRMLTMIGKKFPEAHRFGEIAEAIDKIVLDLQKLIAANAAAQTI